MGASDLALLTPGRQVPTASTFSSLHARVPLPGHSLSWGGPAPALSAVLVVPTAPDVVGDLLVILGVLGNRRPRNAGERNLFLVSLALADLMVALYPYPPIFHDGWALGEVHCKASDFVMGLNVIGSVFNLTAIAINRYCYICPSVAYHQICRWNTRRLPRPSGTLSIAFGRLPKAAGPQGLRTKLCLLLMPRTLSSCSQKALILVAILLDLCDSWLP
ncbi:melatonin receptor type 1B [Vulpes lagopus]|uniref:melatonin receptor type 1B n=1 Tax=Vulpes lagopus TaxID=494514 RepID=UPI001BC9896D|nr:melatonin receptor type 1B [Vulpes lagopus]